MEMNNIEIKHHEKEIKTTIKVGIDNIYTDYEDGVYRFKPLEIVIHKGNIHIGNLRAKGDGLWKNKGLNSKEVYTLVKALRLAIDINENKLEIT